MRCRILLPALMVLIFSGLAGLAAAQTPPAPAYTENGFTPVLLDASAPQSARMQAFSRVIALANQGQVRAQDLAGTLYWWGPKVSGSAVPVNLGQARKLLANAAIHGDVLAMAKMAELELVAGRSMPAMVWAQMYARYLNPARGPRSAKFNGYAAQLINRIVKAGGKADQAVRVGVASLVTRYDKDIRQGIDILQHQEDHGRTFMVQRPQPTQRDSSELTKLGGVAEYMVAFDASGKARQIWPLDAFPHPELQSDLRNYLDNIVANAATGDSGMRYLRVSITHQPYKFRLLRLRH